MASFTVNPINVGYDAIVSIAYSDEFIAVLDISEGELVAQFRDAVNCPVLFTADTALGSIARVGANGLSITIPAATTLSFTQDSVLFDLVHRVSGQPDVVLPGHWVWPIRKPITRELT